jgi:hypothetical protein
MCPTSIPITVCTQLGIVSSIQHLGQFSLPAHGVQRIDGPRPFREWNCVVLAGKPSSNPAFPDPKRGSGEFSKKGWDSSIAVPFKAPEPDMSTVHQSSSSEEFTLKEGEPRRDHFLLRFRCAGLLGRSGTLLIRVRSVREAPVKYPFLR